MINFDLRNRVLLYVYLLVIILHVIQGFRMGSSNVVRSWYPHSMLLHFKPGGKAFDLPLNKNSEVKFENFDRFNRIRLYALLDDEDNSTYVEYNGVGYAPEDREVDNSFDGKGFIGYLAPYAAALILSGFVTIAFFKYFLMDY